MAKCKDDAIRQVRAYHNIMRNRKMAVGELYCYHNGMMFILSYMPYIHYGKMLLLDPQGIQFEVISDASHNYRKRTVLMDKAQDVSILFRNFIADNPDCQNALEHPQYEPAAGKLALKEADVLPKEKRPQGVHGYNDYVTRSKGKDGKMHVRRMAWGQSFIDHAGYNNADVVGISPNKNVNSYDLNCNKNDGAISLYTTDTTRIMAADDDLYKKYEKYDRNVRFSLDTVEQIKEARKGE